MKQTPKLSVLLVFIALAFGIFNASASDFDNIPKIGNISLSGFVYAKTSKAQEKYEKYKIGDGTEPVAVSNIGDAEGIMLSYSVESAPGITNGKKVYNIRILNPNGDVVGSNPEIFEYRGATLKASINVDFDYDGRGATITNCLGTKEKLIPGRYTVEFYSQGYILTKFECTLK